MIEGYYAYVPTENLFQTQKAAGKLHKLYIFLININFRLFVCHNSQGL